MILLLLTLYRLQWQWKIPELSPSLPPSLLSLTSSHCVPLHQCHPQYICGCGSCKKPPQPESIVLLHLLYVPALQPKVWKREKKMRKQGGLNTARPNLIWRFALVLIIDRHTATQGRGAGRRKENSNSHGRQQCEELPFSRLPPPHRLLQGKLVENCHQHPSTPPPERPQKWKTSH